MNKELPPRPGFDFPGPPPKEALEYFRNKGLKVGFDYRDVWRDEHGAAFTVAKCMELDLLSDIRAEVDKALAEGRTFEEFKKDLQPILEKRGWWGKKEMIDPRTGEVRDYQLGSPRRLKTIFRTNMRTARGAGQWERIERNKESHPYLLYSLGPSLEHRPEHVEYDGLLLPVDDPFWRTHYPPNGWGCKCRVRQVSRREAERLGKEGYLRPGAADVDPETGLPTGRRRMEKVPVQTQAPEIRYRAWRNIRTGRKPYVAVGCDPGWDYNPGTEGRWAASLRQAAEKIEGAPEDLAGRALKGLVDSDVFEDWLTNPTGDYPVMLLPKEAAEALGAETRLAVLSAESAKKELTEHRDLKPADYRRLPGIGADPDLVVKDTNKTVVLVKKGDRWDWAVVKAAREGRELYLTSYRRARQKSVKNLMERTDVEVVFSK